MKKINITTDNEFINEKGLQRLVDFVTMEKSKVYPETPSELHTNLTNRMIELFFNTIKLEKDVAILDIGCGQGPALEEFTRRGFKPTGLTLDETDYNICREKGFDVYLMDQSFIDFPDMSFDLIWARHVLEHSLFPNFTVAEYKRLLKPNGILYVEVPLPDQATNQEGNPNHYSVFTKGAWIELFKKAGLKVVWEDFLKLNDIEGEHVESYAAFIIFKEEVVAKPEPTVPETDIYLALSKGENFGWGVCSKYLRQEVSSIYKNTINWDYDEYKKEIEYVDGKVVHALTGLEFESITNLRGTENFGYTFFENELLDISVKNAKDYDLVLGGSKWCQEKMEEKGIKNTGVLVQGVDPEYFHPVTQEKGRNLFVVFSGGKFELRKGQDLVLKAIQILQKKYDDIVLMNVWYNLWPQTMVLMSKSNHMKFELKGDTWTQKMSHIYDINGLDKRRIFTYDLIPNEKLRDLYATTDIGLFPNRCEGGTNLVLMEYMACGKPVIATNATGHRDILTSENSLLLNNNSPYRIEQQGRLWADWVDPSLEEIIEKIEYAYHNRAEINRIGKAAGEHMKKYSWKESAKQLLSIIT